MSVQILNFNNAQRAVLNVVSCLQSEQDLEDLKRTLMKFMNERMQREMDKLWDSGSWSEEKLEAMKTEHLRTSYQEDRCFFTYEACNIKVCKQAKERVGHCKGNDWRKGKQGKENLVVIKSV